MSALVTPEEMRAVEQTAVAAGRSEPELMRAAASGIARRVDQIIRRPADARRLAIAFVGPGNNGGDALVALALLIERGWRCGAILLGRSDVGDLPAQRSHLDQIQQASVDALGEADVILDGVYGVRGKASLPGVVSRAFRRAHDARVQRGTPLIAIDVPSGVDPGSGEADEDAFRADLTLCLGMPKIGLVREPAASHVGELEVIDIGLPASPVTGRPLLITEQSVRSLLPRRRATAHKHNTGAVVVIGGAPTYYGAPRLSAEAALRAGSGLVCAAVPHAIAPVIAAQAPELVFLPLADDGRRAAREIESWIAARSNQVDAAVVGPGLGRDARAEDLLGSLIGSRAGVLVRRSTPLIVDADALYWIAKHPDWSEVVGPGLAVLTPHAGELARLLDISTDQVVRNAIEVARQAAARFNQTVVLKSGFSLVAAPDGAVWVAPRSTPELATAGTGDVLAGLIAGFVAQGLSAVEAARVALYTGAMAGSSARRDLGLLSVIATDVIERVPLVLARMTEPEWER